MRVDEYMYNVMRCTRCGMCRTKYNYYIERVCPTGEFSSGFEYNFPRGKVSIARGILEGDLQYSKELAEVLIMCVGCWSCMEQCGAKDTRTGLPLINPGEITEAMRADCVDLGLAPKAYQYLARNIENHNNPSGEDHKDRFKWADGLDIPTGKSDTILFVGCTPAYQRPEIAKNSANILKAAGVDFSILENEVCCGFPANSAGFINLAKEYAEKNGKALKDAGAKRVVFACSGCYRSMMIDYPKLVGKLPFKLIHITELINELIKEGKIKLKQGINQKVTYHDPCHLGRHLGLYSVPREIIKAIPKLKLIEMFPTEKNSWCCGSGGALKLVHPGMAVEIAGVKIKQAEKTGAKAIVSACPSCKTNITDAINKNGSKLKFYDITELVIKSMEAA
nr:(Fe-S)-binding protein [Candidatus Freyarchaeota archaeon]